MVLLGEQLAAMLPLSLLQVRLQLLVGKQISLHAAQQLPFVLSFHGKASPPAAAKRLSMCCAGGCAGHLLSQNS
jgi:hypothetical protein